MFCVMCISKNNRQILKEVRKQSVDIWGQSFLDSKRSKNKHPDIGGCMWVQRTGKRISISLNFLVLLKNIYINT